MGQGVGSNLAKISQQWLCHLLVTIFALRALVPVGFMPEVRADGQLAVVICTASGFKTLDLHVTGSQNEQHKKHKSEHCAFSGLGHVSFAVTEAQNFFFREFAIAGAPTLATFVLPPPRAGPILGSRAPPLLS